MRLNEEISPEEYAKKKDDLLREKQKYEELIGDTQQRIETWLERADKAFTFAQTAQNRFKTGTLEDKRYIPLVFRFEPRPDGQTTAISGRQKPCPLPRGRPRRTKPPQPVRTNATR